MTVRRSSRSRTQTRTVYDDAVVNLRKSVSSVEDPSESDEELKVREEEDASSSDEQAPKSRKRKASAVPLAASRTAKPAARVPVATQAPSQKTAASALKTLASKVLDPSEMAENSLVAALLQAGTAVNKGKNNQSPYTVAIRRVVFQVIQIHQKDPNKAQISLFNLIFRSVGGNVNTLLDPQEIDLENTSDEEWSDFVNSVFEAMQSTPIDQILLCANPVGPKGAKGGKALVALREYRKIYQEFWYLLGTTALEGSGANTTENDQELSVEESSLQNDSRFAVELVRDILDRLIEIVGVGQPDMRAASTMGIYQLASAMLDHSVTLQEKLETAQRQYNSAKRNSQKAKGQALKAQIDNWKRTIADLEESVKETVVGVFLNRYRDVDPYIRKESLAALSKFTTARPDIFLCGKYLKYFGWLLSDKHAIVREQALQGLLTPFQTKERMIDVKSMQSVAEKFAPRLADCVLDVDVATQEKAMELLVCFNRNGLLDNLEDEHLWEQINARALDPETSPKVRRLALEFVLEQLEAFDSGSCKSDAKAIERIKAIVSWVAHNLSDSEIPVDQVQYQLADLVVISLRDMPDHKELMCNWSAMLRALELESPQTEKEEYRQEAVSQRVILRMLAFSAELEVQLSTDDVLNEEVDQDLLLARQKAEESLDSKKKRKIDNVSTHEDLTIACIQALPNLLEVFKSDTSVLRSLTRLPQYFLPSVFNLPSRKLDFDKLLSNLGACFSESTDHTVLNNCGVALTVLVKGDHARRDEVFLKIKKLANSLGSRLQQLLKIKEEEKDPWTPNKEHALALCLRRLTVLSKRWYLGDLLECNGEENSDNAVETVCVATANGIGKDLGARMVTHEKEKAVIPPLWNVKEKQLHSLVAESVDAALTLLLSVLAWNLHKALEKGDIGNPEDHMIIRLRDGLVKLILLCFDQFVDAENDESTYTPEQSAFADAVQKSAGRAAGDLRTLFPKDFARAESPLLRACALTDDRHIIGGFVRFVRSNERLLRSMKDERSLTDDLLLPIARGLCTNWPTGNRREAGVVISHIAGSGPYASKLVSAMSRTLKKIDPVRLLEAHMAGLRQDFDEWLESEPEEPESDHPSDEELASFEKAEDNHKQRLEAIEHQAQRMSASLGVGRLSDQALAGALSGFLRESVRFAFSTREPEYDDELPLGTNLSFLLLASKYIGWIRKDEERINAIRTFLDRKEAELRNHPDFRQVLEDDLKAISTFRNAGDLGQFYVEDDTGTGLKSDTSARPSTSSLRRRMSIASSVSSIRSKTSGTSGQTSLSPLVEENSVDDELVTSKASQSSFRVAQSPIEEHSDEGSEES